MILSTCKNTEIPPVPSKNAVRIIFIEIIFIGMLEIKEIPFVISKKPVSKGAINEVGMCKNSKQGTNINVSRSINPLVLKIDIITEKSTTNPPIIIIVEVALEIEFAIASPRFAKVKGLGLLFEKSVTLLLFLELDAFQNLNKNPTVIQAKICVIKSNTPIKELLNILIPTVPTINRGPRIISKTK